MIRLWSHECLRVFSDRLVDAVDADWFNNALSETCAAYFRTHYSVIQQQFYIDQLEAAGGVDDSTLDRGQSVLPASTVHAGAGGNALLFADFSDSDNSSKAYNQVSSDGHVYHILQHYLDEYNSLGVGQRMPLVLFSSAREHVVRVARVLHQTQGHAVLIGMGGSGRRSVCKLAAHIRGLACHEYRPGDVWRDTVKDVMLKVCNIYPLFHPPVCFLDSCFCALIALRLVWKVFRLLF